MKKREERDDQQGCAQVQRAVRSLAYAGSRGNDYSMLFFALILTVLMVSTSIFSRYGIHPTFRSFSKRDDRFSPKAGPKSATISR